MPASMALYAGETVNGDVERTPQQLWQDVDRLLQQTNGSLFSESNGIAWELRYEVQQLLERILIQDIDYALQKEADVLLWNACHKSCIDFLRRKRKNNFKNAAGELQMLLSASLGFLHRLLTSVCVSYKLKVPGFNHPPQIGGMTEKKTCSPENAVSIVEFCLIHLGDVSRYQNDIQLAESFYGRAAALSPSKGHAFNQLGIVEAARGNKLTAAYFYCLSLNVAHPFQPAAGNLESLFSAKEAIGSAEPANSRDSFVRLHACLQHFHRLHDARNTYLPAFGSFLETELVDNKISSKECYEMFVITISALWRISNPFPTQENDKFEVDDLSRDERISHAIARRLLEALIVAIIAHVSEQAIRLDSSSKKETENFSEWLKLVGLCLQFTGTLSRGGEIATLFSQSRIAIAEKACQLLKGLRTMWNTAEIDFKEMEKIARYSRPAIDEIKLNGTWTHEKHCRFWNSLPTMVPSEIAWMPLPENGKLMGFCPFKETVNSVVCFDGGWQQDGDPSVWPVKATSLCVYERRILRNMSSLAQLLSNRCSWTTGEAIVDLDLLSDWDRVKTLAKESDEYPVPLPKDVPLEKRTPSTVSSTHSTPQRRSKVSDRLSELMKQPNDVQDSVLSAEVKSPPGLLKLKMPAEIEETKSPVKEPERKRNDSDYRPRFQPPRFQAAKLKQALTGKASDPSIGAFDPTVSSFLPSFLPPQQPGEKRYDEKPESQRCPSPKGVTTPDTGDMTGPWNFSRTPGTRPPFPLFGPRPTFFQPYPGAPPARLPYPFPENQHGSGGMRPPTFSVPPPGFPRGPQPGIPPQQWSRAPATNISEASSYATPPPDNSVFFSNPKDPFYQVWQNDSPLGSGPASEEASQEVWGSGSIQQQKPAAGSSALDFNLFNSGRNPLGYPFNAPQQGASSHQMGSNPAAFSHDNQFYQRWSAEDGTEQ